MVSSWFLGPALRLNSVELSLLLAPPLGMNSLLHVRCCPWNNASSFYKLLRHFSLAEDRLRAPLSRFLGGTINKCPEWMKQSSSVTAACAPQPSLPVSRRRLKTVPFLVIAQTWAGSASESLSGAIEIINLQLQCNIHGSCAPDFIRRLR